MATPTEKSCLSPFLFITYLAVSITGVLMLFHIRFPGLNAIHEWVGLAFVIAGVLHMCVNWARFKSYFTMKRNTTKAVWATAIALVLVLTTALWVPSIKGHNSGGNGQYFTNSFSGGNYHQNRGR